MTKKEVYEVTYKNHVGLVDKRRVMAESESHAIKVSMRDNFVIKCLYAVRVR